MLQEIARDTLRDSLSSKWGWSRKSDYVRIVMISDFDDFSYYIDKIF